MYLLLVSKKLKMILISKNFQWSGKAKAIGLSEVCAENIRRAVTLCPISYIEQVINLYWYYITN